MINQTIAQIKDLFSKDNLSDETIALLKRDKRVGVQKLIQKYENDQLKMKQRKERFEQMMWYERALYKAGNTYVAGIDEAGRGPLAGPVVAAAVILKQDFFLPGLNDSKQLNKFVREEFYEVILKEAVSYGIGIIDSHEIDQLNIFEATKKAMKVAVGQLNPSPDHILIDAVQLDNLLCPSNSIIKGDQKSISIAAASILAKVTRDKLMMKINEEYPVYHFASNMGYGTKEHLEAINEYGPCPYHRHSFAPIKDASK